MSTKEVPFLSPMRPYSFPVDESVQPHRSLSSVLIPPDKSFGFKNDNISMLLHLKFPDLSFSQGTFLPNTEFVC